MAKHERREVSREQLYASVWAEPMSAAAKKYGVSSSFLSRVCERMEVPHPVRGYWALKAVGRAAPVPRVLSRGQSEVNTCRNSRNEQ